MIKIWHVGCPCCAFSRLPSGKLLPGHSLASQPAKAIKSIAALYSTSDSHIVQLDMVGHSQTLAHSSTLTLSPHCWAPGQYGQGQQRPAFGLLPQYCPGGLYTPYCNPVICCPYCVAGSGAP